MTHLRKMMLEELERRNYAQATIDCYLRAVSEFSFHFHRPPNQLGPEHIRQYQAHLFGQRKLAPSTVTQRLAALRFFYIKTLRKPWSIAETPYPKKVQRLPIILSSEEVAQLIDSALTPFHHILLMALYATGARRAELARLKIIDIDSQRMIIHIQGAKGRKDRDVMLSPKLLEALREYWRGLRRKPKHWLFPGGRSHTSESSHQSQDHLECLPKGCPTGGYPQEDPSAYPAPLLRNSSAGGRCRFAHHSGAVGSP